MERYNILVLEIFQQRYLQEWMYEKQGAPKRQIIFSIVQHIRPLRKVSQRRSKCTLTSRRAVEGIPSSTSFRRTFFRARISRVLTSRALYLSDMQIYGAVSGIVLWGDISEEGRVWLGTQIYTGEDTTWTRLRNLSVVVVYLGQPTVLTQHHKCPGLSPRDSHTCQAPSGR